MSDEDLARRNVYEIYLPDDEEAMWVTSDGSQFGSYDDAVSYELWWLQQPAE